MLGGLCDIYSMASGHAFGQSHNFGISIIGYVKQKTIIPQRLTRYVEPIDRGTFPSFVSHMAAINSSHPKKMKNWRSLEDSNLKPAA